MGTSPMVVLAVTLAVPVRSSAAESLSVTCVNIASKAPLLSDRNGTLWKLIGSGTVLPVEMPPTLLESGKFNCAINQAGQPRTSEGRKSTTSAAGAFPVIRVMSTAD